MAREALKHAGLKALGFWLAAVLAVVPFCGPALAEGSSIVIANDEWIPYLSETLPHHGPVGRIITEAFALEGVEVIYKWMPWKRAFEETKAGAYDATSGWISTPERRLHFLYSDVLFVTKKVFFHLREYPFNWWRMKDLQGLRIGAVKGYAYGEAFDTAAENETITVERLVDERTNFDKLLRGRIHIYPQELEVGLAYLKDMDPGQRDLLTYHPKPLVESEYFLIFSGKVAKNKTLVEKFNQGLRKLRECGKYQEYWDEVSKALE